MLDRVPPREIERLIEIAGRVSLPANAELRAERDYGWIAADDGYFAYRFRIARGQHHLLQHPEREERPRVRLQGCGKPALGRLQRLHRDHDSDPVGSGQATPAASST